MVHTSTFQDYVLVGLPLSNITTLRTCNAIRNARANARDKDSNENRPRVAKPPSQALWCILVNTKRSADSFNSRNISKFELKFSSFREFLRECVGNFISTTAPLSGFSNIPTTITSRFSKYVPHVLVGLPLSNITTLRTCNAIRNARANARDKD